MILVYSAPYLPQYKTIPIP